MEMPLQHLYKISIKKQPLFLLFKKTFEQVLIYNWEEGGKWGGYFQGYSRIGIQLC